MITLIEKARAFATAAHAAVQQVRKYTGEPYINHPIEVAQIVGSVGGSDEQIAAALLHDVVEDTGVTIELIYKEFGQKVGDYVMWLTDVSKPEDGNRKVRKALDREHTAASPPEVKTVKLADLISNSKSILEHDRNFARVYLREKQELMAVLTEGDPTLYAQAQKLLEEGFVSLYQEKSEVASQ